MTVNIIVAEDKVLSSRRLVVEFQVCDAAGVVVAQAMEFASLVGCFDSPGYLKMADGMTSDLDLDLLR